MKRSFIEILVGIFVVLAVGAFALLAFQVSGLTSSFGNKDYTVKAPFDNIGGLKVRAAVTISGVKVGEVSAIELNQTTFQAVVSMKIFSHNNHIPEDSSVSIFTSGLVGANYISISPGYSENFLHEGSVMTTTHPALILENLISQYLFSLKK